MARSRAEREDDQSDLEALEEHALEGEPARGPVTPVCSARQRGGGVARLDELVVRARAAAAAGDPEDALAQPFEAEKQQRAADDHSQHGYSRTGPERRTQDEAQGHNA